MTEVFVLVLVFALKSLLTSLGISVLFCDLLYPPISHHSVCSVCLCCHSRTVLSSSEIAL